ncbi:hypothetical protein A9Q89_12790 [Gammaproteobacteria bacterium 53_120_T64]|nr:hypothetical protein A9Q89_12790 [Gammaproteobacteria bacterium 53_120_T64]
MKILLTVITAPHASPLLDQVISLGDGDGIGRSASNALILADEQRVISSRHALVKQKDSTWLLIDQSTNGTFYNELPEAIGKNNSQALSSGDLVKIGDYQFSIGFSQPSTLPDGLEHASFLDNVDAPANIPAPTLDAPIAIALAPPMPPAAIAQTLPDTPQAIDQPDDFDQWLSPTTGTAAPQPWASSHTDGLSSGKALHNDGQFSSGEEINPDPLAALEADTASWSDTATSSDNDNQWWQSELDNVPAHQQAMPAVNIAVPEPASPAPQALTPAPAERPAEITAVTPESTALAELLGLRNLSAQQQANLAPTSAAIIQQTTKHLLSLLQSRASIKNELRTSRTMIQTTENNPLKFSASSADALQALFASTSDSFLPAEQAVKESFEDIADHQIAMLFAMKAAFNEMLGNFHPTKLEATFNTSGKGLLASLKPRQWENYGALYQELQNDPETSYNQLFGEAFAQAYEAKLLDLKASRRFE